MSDRQLLEDAAKAAGIEQPTGQDGFVSPDGTFVYYLDCEGKTSRRWNPLTDDGDALRLMTKLGIGVEWWSAMPDSMAGRVTFDHNGAIMMANVDDRAAMLRRCITRAAAAISSQNRGVE